MIDARQTRKFKDVTYYNTSLTNTYHLLPFRFHRLNKHKEVLVNEVGDFIIVTTGTAETIIKRELSKITHPELYGDLIANFFISEERIPPLLDVISTRYRTKKSFL